jgi:hypothetical protein
MSADTIARLKISLDDAKPAVLRRVEVPFDIRLDRLHLTIQAAMGWTNSHLYEIRAGNVGWSTPDPDADWASDFIDARKARLGDILEDIGTKTLAYLYDFGDGWEHTIKIEHLADPEPGVLYPRLIEVSGRCPPEDCGAPGAMPNSSRPSRIPSTNATPNSRNGSATTSIPTPTTLKGSPRKLPPSPKLGLGSPPAKARDVANPRPSPAFTGCLPTAFQVALLIVDCSLSGRAAPAGAP